MFFCLTKEISFIPVKQNDAMFAVMIHGKYEMTHREKTETQNI